MYVLCTRFQNEAHRGQSAQSIRHRRLASCDPYRVGNNNRIGCKIPILFFHEGLEVRATDLFLEFPDELDVNGNILIDRITGTEESRQRRPLVIRRSAASITIALFFKN